MKVRTRRIISWITALVIAAIFMFCGEFINNVFFVEKKPITVCAPEDMKSAFETALDNSDLEDCKIVMSTNSKSNITVDYAKENDKSYIKFAFSPFIIAYNSENKYFKALKESNVLVQSEFNKDYYDIDFLKVINEVTEEGVWSNLGIKDFTQIKIFYPSEETIYWHDFYNFMLVTVNNGIYPQTEDELKKADETIQKFIDSNCTEAVSNFDEKVERVGGFPGNSFFVLPEKTAIELHLAHSKPDVRFLYPIYTTYFNYYVKGDKIGKQIILAFEKKSTWLKSNLYSELILEFYRSEQNLKLSTTSGALASIDDVRNIYNVSNIPKDNILSTLNKENTTP
ncbi:MAG: hypothetical protein IJE05_04010 [Clostridia bacterium]|nr:hypothetical protein [Clostridia bacterium]